MAKDYTKELREKGQERIRLTKQLQEMLLKVAEEIAENVDEGTEVEVADALYRVHRYESNIGSFRTIVISYPDEYRHMCYRAIDNESPGSEYYLHRDFNSVVVVAERDEFLHFANHLPEIVRAFEAKEDEVIAELRSTFEKLRKLAEE